MILLEQGKILLSSCAEDRIDRHPQKEQDGDLIQESTPPPNLELVRQVPKDADDEREMQKDQLRVEGGTVADR